MDEVHARRTLKGALGGVMVAMLTTSVDAADFAFRGAELGMSLEVWKAAPPPEQIFHPARPVCSDTKPDALWVTPTKSERAAGVITCIYEDAEFGSRVGQRIGSSEFTGTTYLFLDGRLYNIDLMAIDVAHDDVVEGLRAKYGEPKTTVRGTFQTKAGAVFPQVTMTWESPTSLIVVETPSEHVDRMTVNYISKADLLRIRQAGKDADPAADKM